MIEKKGFFITLEGGEGAGKTTLAKELTQHLNDTGYAAVYLRDPGGVPSAMSIRELLLKGDTDKFSPKTELLLFAAARNELIERGIAPALAEGKVVVCDRFFDTTITHQGYGGGFDLTTIFEVQKIVVGEKFVPNLTIILDLPAEEGLKRGRGHTVGETRFEDKGVAFHERARQGFLEIAAMNPNRCVVVDAMQPIEAVRAEVFAIAVSRIAARRQP